MGRAKPCRIPQVTFATLLFTIGVANLCGCSGAGSGPSQTLVPVEGQVFVDGQPATMVQVICHEVGRSSCLVPPTVTDDQGRFRLSTYEQGDGVPAGGQYVLTFRWSEFEPITMSFRGEDKLKGRYADPATSAIRFRAERGKPVQLGRIDLSSGS